VTFDWLHWTMPPLPDPAPAPPVLGPTPTADHSVWEAARDERLRTAEAQHAEAAADLALPLTERIWGWAATAAAAPPAAVASLWSKLLELLGAAGGAAGAALGHYALLALLAVLVLRQLRG
jgi:hypothetical protein